MSTAEFSAALTAQEAALIQMGYRFTRNRDDLQDLVQDTFAKALRYKDRFADGTNLKAWLFVMMKNIFINQYNQFTSRRTFTDGTAGEYYLNAHGASGQSLTERELLGSDLNQAMQTLSDRFRIPFQRHTDGYQYDEIAEELQIPIGTVKSRIFKAREKLQAELRDYRQFASSTAR